MLLQKQIISDHYDRLARAHDEGKKVVYTFVPGNLNELVRSFDLLPVLPEINALQSGMRKLSGDYIAEAEKQGHSEDVCTYVKCDIGMLKKGNIGPTGKPLPKPDLLLLSYTGCFTFMKWFELLRQEYGDVPVAMLHVPYQANGRVEPHQREYVIKQIRSEVIPALEKAFSTPGPVVVDMMVDREENVFPMVPAGGANKDMILERPGKETKAKAAKSQTGF